MYTLLCFTFSSILSFSVFTFFFWSFLITALERLDSTVLFPIDFLDFPLVFEFRLTVTAPVFRFLFLVFG